MKGKESIIYMKVKTLILICLACSLPISGASKLNEPSKKFLHFAIPCVSAALTFSFTRSRFVGVGIGVALTEGKETYDCNHGGYRDPEDIILGYLGTFTGVSIAILNKKVNERSLGSSRRQRRSLLESRRF